MLALIAVSICEIFYESYSSNKMMLATCADNCAAATWHRAVLTGAKCGWWCCCCALLLQTYVAHLHVACVAHVVAAAAIIVVGILYGFDCCYTCKHQANRRTMPKIPKNI